RWSFDEMMGLFTRAYPYSNLTPEELEKTLDYMNSRFPRLAWVSMTDRLVLKPLRNKAVYEYYFDNLSMIPEEKNYLVIDEEKDSAVGILDESFVAEYGRPGVKFIIRGSPWKIHSVREDQIYVRSVDDPTGAIPSWIGEEIPVPFEVAQEVGRIRSFVEESAKKGLTLDEIAKKLVEKYPVEFETASRAISEVYEHVKFGYDVPTDRKLVLEDWEDFVIIHAHFGSLTNRAFAQLLGHILSEELGYAIAVQHDPYRIFVQTMGDADSKRVAHLFEEIKSEGEVKIREDLKNAVSRTGIFKRRLVHVARRFGALEKWADISKLTLKSLVKNLEGTAIFDEALKETFTKDLDLEHLMLVVKMIRDGEMQIITLETGGKASPVARLGIEKAQMKTDIIPPERLKMVVLESAKARLLNEARTFICTECWDYAETLRIRELPDNPTCPKCGSNLLGILELGEEDLYSIIEKRGSKLTKSEMKIAERAKNTAELISKYGKAAAVALSGRRLNTKAVEEILKAEKYPEDGFYELIIEAEKRSLKEAFW
ncbi:MAG: ATP-dependent helicase, partial [Candidatus Bathyarchaeia archaeon]